MKPNHAQALNGLQTESNFANFIRSLGFNPHKVGSAYDIYHHFDLNISADVEIKGRKAMSRGSELQDDYHWIELQGVRDDGWLYNSHADVIAFETNDTWIMVRPSDLIQYTQRFVEHESVERPQEAIHKIYTRRNRNDIITLVPTSDLRSIGWEVKKK
jgi:hypothetical protein